MSRLSKEDEAFIDEYLAKFATPDQDSVDRWLLAQKAELGALRAELDAAEKHVQIANAASADWHSRYKQAVAERDAAVKDSNDANWQKCEEENDRLEAELAEERARRRIDDERVENLIRAAEHDDHDGRPCPVCAFRAAEEKEGEK